MNLHDVLDIVCDHLPVGALGRLCRCSKGIRNALTGNEALWTSKLQMKRFVGLVQMNRLFENPQRCVECGKYRRTKLLNHCKRCSKPLFRDGKGRVMCPSMCVTHRRKTMSSRCCVSCAEDRLGFRRLLKKTEVWSFVVDHCKVHRKGWLPPRRVVLDGMEPQMMTRNKAFLYSPKQVASLF